MHLRTSKPPYPAPPAQHPPVDQVQGGMVEASGETGDEGDFADLAATFLGGPGTGPMGGQQQVPAQPGSYMGQAGPQGAGYPGAQAGGVPQRAPPQAPNGAMGAGMAKMPAQGPMAGAAPHPQMGMPPQVGVVWGLG